MTFRPNFKARFSGCLITAVLACVSSFTFAHDDTTPHTEVIEAILQADTQRLQQFDQHHDWVNQLLPDQSTPLAWAVESQNPEMVELLLELGAKADHPSGTQNDFTPLVLACIRGMDEITNLLLAQEADVNNPTSDGITPFSLCAGSSGVNVVKAMIQSGANINQADQNGQTPLMRAASAGLSQNVELLLEKGAEINAISTGGFTPLFFALKSKNKTLPLALLKAGADHRHTTPDGTTAIQLALYQGHYAFAAKMIKLGAITTDYDRNGNQPLHAAILANQKNLVQLLLSQGANANALTGESKVIWRYEVNFTSAPYVTYKKSPLLLAAESGSVEMMQLLVDAGAEVGYQNDEGMDVLLAAAQSNPSALRLALALQPNSNIQNISGQTPLHRLVEIGTESTLNKSQIIEMMTLLANHGAQSNIKDKNGKSPRDLVIEYDFLAKAEFLNLFQQQAAL